MYFLQNKITGQPVLNPKIYRLRLLAVYEQKKTEKNNPTLNTTRTDVVEISNSARLYMENQARLETIVSKSTSKNPKPK
jgi:hypothetical protein